MTVFPLHYILEFYVPPNEPEFTGHETIIVLVEDPCETLTLNSVDLEILSVKLDGEQVEFDTDKEEQTLTLNAKFHLLHEIDISFKGPIGTTPSGIFRGSEDDYIATHFEPIAARKAFVCFDDPRFRSTFQLIITTSFKYKVLSNTDVEKSERLEEQLQKTTFETTPVIPAYLVAFFISEFNSTSFSFREKTVNIWSIPELQDQHEFAGDIAVKALEFFTQKFGIGYPLSKLDIVGIPDFTKGAMENMGLIISKENCLLVNAESSQYDKEEVAESIFHEIAHQWFGNIVGIESWEDLWLKEGFATWFSWLAIDHFFPDWRTFETYLVYTLQDALISDARNSTHPVKVAKTTIHDINQDFDDITYKKGCAVVTMLSKWLGEEVLLKGLSVYLQKYTWKLVSTFQLWESLSQISNSDVSGVMNKWIETEGFPVVTVEENAENIQLVQRRFFASGFKSDSDETYPISLDILLTDGLIQKTMFFENALSLPIKPTNLVKINIDLIGFYRTAYCVERWKKLNLLKDSISIKDKIGLIADAFQLSSAGLLPITCFMDISQCCSSETNFNIWNEITTDLYSILDAFIYSEEIKEEVEKLIRRFVKKKVQSCLVPEDNDSMELSLFKSCVCSAAYIAEDETVIKYCHDQFKKFCIDPKSIHPDRRSTILKCVAKRGGDETFDTLIKIYEEEEFTIQKDILGALGKFENEKILYRLINFLKSNVSAQDVWFTLNAMLMHRAGVDVLWSWIQKEWTLIGELFDFESENHISIVETCLHGLCLRTQAHELDSFFKDKTGPFVRVAKKAKEKIMIKASWAERDEQSLLAWFKGQ